MRGDGWPTKPFGANVIFGAKIGMRPNALCASTHPRGPFPKTTEKLGKLFEILPIFFIRPLTGLASQPSD